MSKILLWSDLHSHNYREFSESINGTNSRLLDCCNVILELRKFVDENNINQIIFLGDCFHLKNNLSSEVIKLTMDALDNLVANIQMVVLPGNHDFTLWSSKPILLELFQQYIAKGKIRVITEPTWIDNYYYEPYTRRIEELNERLKNLETKENLIFFGHQDMIGVYYGGHQVTRGLDPKILAEKFKWSFVGHYHKPTGHHTANIFSIGAPLQHNFSDAFQPRGWRVYDDETNDVKFHQNTFSPVFFDIKASEASVEIPGDPEKDFYRITVAGHELPELYHQIKWKRVNFESQKDKKSRSTILFSDKTEDLIAKYVDLKLPEGLDRDRLITTGRKYL